MALSHRMRLEMITRKYRRLILNDIFLNNKSSIHAGELYKALKVKEIFYTRGSSGKLIAVDSVEYLLTMDDDSINGLLGMPIRFKPRNNRKIYE